jgi:hypothetical protein
VSNKNDSLPVQSLTFLHVLFSVPIATRAHDLPWQEYFVRDQKQLVLFSKIVGNSYRCIMSGIADAIRSKHGEATSISQIFT